MYLIGEHYVLKSNVMTPVAVLGTTGPGPKPSAGPLFENFLLPRVFFKFFVEIVIHDSCTLHFPIKPTH